MNLLQLVQRTMTDCGVSGVIITTAGQVGSIQRIVNWVGTAWEELQTKRDDWDWMKSSVLLGGGVSIVTVAGQASYPLGVGAGKAGVAAAAFGKWDNSSFRNYPTAVGTSGEIFMAPISYPSWRDGYMFGAQRTVQTRPVAVAIGPDKSVCLGPPPDATYTVTGSYWTAPTVMAADTDVPTGLPTQYHMLIVYNAMMMYGAYESAGEVYQRGENKSKELMSQLMTNYTSEITSGEPLC